MGDDFFLLLDRIRLLLDRPSDEPGVDKDVVEDTLTDGYARALALEAERRRLEARVRELAGQFTTIGEQRVLKARLERIDDDLAQLRALLDSLAATLKTPA